MGSDLLDVLWAECEMVSEAALDLPESDFSLPTRCTEWDVKELLAHLYRDIERLPVSLAQPEPDSADHDFVSYWRGYDDNTAIANRAKTRAASYRSGAELARVWDWMWRKALEDCRGEPPRRLLATWGPSMHLDDFLMTRVMEVGVHGLDLADAIGREPWITPAAIEVIRRTLVHLLGAEPYVRLGWDDIAFIEKGTGRQPLTDPDRAILGDVTDQFPLIA